MLSRYRPTLRGTVIRQYLLLQRNHRRIVKGGPDVTKKQTGGSHSIVQACMNLSGTHRDFPVPEGTERIISRHLKCEEWSPLSGFIGFVGWVISIVTQVPSGPAEARWPIAQTKRARRAVARRKAGSLVNSHSLVRTTRPLRGHVFAHSAGKSFIRANSHGSTSIIAVADQ